MKYNSKQYAEALYNLLSAASGDEFSHRVRSFLNILRKEGQMKYLTQILARFENIEQEKTGRRRVTVACAGALRPEALEELERIFPNADIHETPGESLMGGAVVQWNDFRVDGSVRGRLRALRSALT